MNIDLLPSRLNIKIDKFVGWKADPLAVDALTLTWDNFMFYAFSPFSIIDKVCQTIMVDRAEAILVNTELVPISYEALLEASIFNKTREGCFDTEQRTRNTSSVTLLVFHVSGQHFNNIIYQRDQYLLL